MPCPQIMCVRPPDYCTAWTTSTFSMNGIECPGCPICTHFNVPNTKTVVVTIMNHTILIL